MKEIPKFVQKLSREQESVAGGSGGGGGGGGGGGASTGVRTDKKNISPVYRGDLIWRGPWTLNAQTGIK